MVAHERFGIKQCRNQRRGDCTFPARRFLGFLLAAGEVLDPSEPQMEGPARCSAYVTASRRLGLRIFLAAFLMCFL